MYSPTVRDQALSLLSQGSTISETSRRTGISRYALREWQLRASQGLPLFPGGARDCPRCEGIPQAPEDKPAYAYLLGMYLGDGCVSKTHRDDVTVLRIACADAWPGVLEECRQAMLAVRPHSKVSFVQNQGCKDVKSYSKHWTCLFPQHGLGEKHKRKITLATWQRKIVDEFPEPFVRGLIHSDGSRFMNRVRHIVDGKEHWYEYPRYTFSQKSEDIKALFTDALDRLGIPWKVMNRMNISIARKDAVARLDEFVGPKY
jgi:hypothetical protein